MKKWEDTLSTKCTLRNEYLERSSHGYYINNCLIIKGYNES